jgi:hypothetical protein
MASIEDFQKIDIRVWAHYRGSGISRGAKVGVQVKN